MSAEHLSDCALFTNPLRGECDCWQTRAVNRAQDARDAVRDAGARLAEAVRAYGSGEPAIGALFSALADYDRAVAEEQRRQQGGG